MARNYGIECYNTLTGFKYIAQLMRELEGKKQFVAAGEESYGYMVGDFVRDKDAVSACAFFAAMAASAEEEGKSLYDWLIDMYVGHGFFKEGLINVVKKGQQGEQEIKAMMTKFRNNPPNEMLSIPVVKVLDYSTLQEKNFETRQTSTLQFPKSDVLQFYLKDGTKISVRPSGTEPKIKFYISVFTELKSSNEFLKTEQQLDTKIKSIEDYLMTL
jgi:phosphoglucomutase